MARRASSGFVPGLPRQPGAAFAACVSYQFERIGISATLVDVQGWHVVHRRPNVVDFETEHGREAERWAYNDRAMARAARTGRSVVALHAGFHDLFVPVKDDGQACQILITGPFLRAPITAANLIERWQNLTGRYAHPQDPEFSHYASVALETVVLDAERVRVLCRFAERLAHLVSGKPAGPRAMRVLERLTHTLASARFAENMWEAARTMVDPSTARVWSSTTRADQRVELGLERMPEQVAAGLLAAKGSGEPVEDLVRRNAFQRACVDFCRSRGGLVAGRLGDHGVFFLVPGERSATRWRVRFADLAQSVADIARRFGFRIHLGTSPGVPGSGLPENFRLALAAAEEALTRDSAVVHSTGVRSAPTSSLSELRRELAQPPAGTLLTLSARFQRYAELLTRSAGYHRGTVSMGLAVGFERLVEPLLASGMLTPQTFTVTVAELERAVAAAATVDEVATVYRRTVLDLERRVGAPAAKSREPDLLRSIEFIGDNFGRSIRRADAARAGGFAPDYFSRVFKKHTRSTFEHYVERLRLERAKQLLMRTGLGVEAVARLSGFASGSYFHRVFRRTQGSTPMDYRLRVKRAARSSRSWRRTPDLKLQHPGDA